MFAMFGKRSIVVLIAIAIMGLASMAKADSTLIEVSFGNGNLQESARIPEDCVGRESQVRLEVTNDDTVNSENSVLVETGSDAFSELDVERESGLVSVHAETVTLGEKVTVTGLIGSEAEEFSARVRVEISCEGSSESVDDDNGELPSQYDQTTFECTIAAEDFTGAFHWVSPDGIVRGRDYFFYGKGGILDYTAQIQPGDRFEFFRFPSGTTLEMAQSLGVSAEYIGTMVLVPTIVNGDDQLSCISA